MSWPSSASTLPDVTVNQLSTSAGQNGLIDLANTITQVFGLNPASTYADVATRLNNLLPLSGATMTGNLDMGTHLINNVSTPLLATDAANKGYVDAIGQTLHIKQSVRVTSTGANVVIATGGLITLDGVTLVAGDRVLLRDQTTGSENGIYVAATGAWSRSTDANTSALVVQGMYTLVTQGTAHANQGWVLITANPITLGTTALTFSQFNAATPPGAATGANADINSMRALNGVLQAPTQINDINGNAMLGFTSVAAAVNNLTTTNAATGPARTLSAVGVDANVNLNLAPKGTGIALVSGSAQINANGNPALLIKSIPASVGVLPSTITGLLLWLKADAITGFTNGSALTTWADSSGVGNNATASTTAPTYYTGQLNTLPIVTFDGIDDTMTLGTADSTIRTAFWVLREVPSASFNHYRSLIGSSTSTNFLRGTNGEIFDPTASASVLNGVTRLNGAVVPSPSTTLFPQGPFQIVSVITTANTNANQITQTGGNATYVWYGDIAEIILYNAALSDTDRGNVEAYLAHKYALPLTVAAAANLLDVRDPGNNPVFVVTGGGGQRVKVVVFAVGATYVATSSDYIIVVNKITGSATAVTLPSTPSAGQVLTVKDGKGDAATNNITITPASGSIDGAASMVLSTNYAVSRLVYNGTQWNAL